jgi:hypothetical protein
MDKAISACPFLPCSTIGALLFDGIDQGEVMTTKAVDFLGQDEGFLDYIIADSKRLTHRTALKNLTGLTGFSLTSYLNRFIGSLWSWVHLHMTAISDCRIKE